MIAAILVIATVCSLAVPAFAAKDEEYISELRLVYAEDYNEAKAIIAEGVCPRIICESDGTMSDDALAMKQIWLNLLEE